MTKIIRIGLFGASSILERVMCETFINHPNFLIVGLASKTSERLEKISKKIQCDMYTSYNDLINNNIIDAAYISLPNSLHYELTKKLLNKRIHCLVEKPMTCSKSKGETSTTEAYSAILLLSPMVISTLKSRAPSILAA